MGRLDAPVAAAYGVPMGFVFALLMATAPERVTLPRTEVLTISSADGTAYELKVALPREVTAGLPVVYVLDAEYAFAITRNVAEHLTDRKGLPPLIVVGVGYPGGIEGEGWLRRYRVQRTRDYTPTKSPIGYPDGVQDVSGGGPAFLEFLEERVVPAIEQRYGASSDRALVGHSYGGLFAVWAALQRPELFTRIAAVSPSLWHDRRFVFGVEAARHAELKALPVRFFFAAGSRENVAADGDIAGDIGRFSAKLRADFPKVRADAVVFDAETHDSVFPSAVSRALRVLFDGKERPRLSAPSGPVSVGAW